MTRLGRKPSKNPVRLTGARLTMVSQGHKRLVVLMASRLSLSKQRTIELGLESIATPEELKEALGENYEI